MIPHSPHERLPGPDIVRAIAIVLVVLAHTSGMWRTGHEPVTLQHIADVLLPRTATPSAKDSIALMPRGRTWVPAVIGVELFFVLSGYLIGGILIREIAQNGRFSLAQLRRFLVRRWLRTLPAYWLVITLLIPVWMLVLKKKLTWSVLLYFVFLQNITTPHPGFFSVAWSLSVEEWFYITLPVVLWLVGSTIRKTSGEKWLLRCLLAYLAIALGMRACNAIWLPYGTDFDNGIRKLVLTRLDAPLYGVLVAWCLRYKPQILQFKTPLLVLSVAFTVLLAALMYYLEPGGLHTNHRFYFPFNTVWLYTLLPAAMALCLPAAVAYRSAGKNLWQSCCTFIARISYSIYLTHYYLFYVLPFSRIHFTNLPAQLLFYIGYLLVVCLVSSALYFFVEKSFLRLRDRLFPAVNNCTHAAGA